MIVFGLLQAIECLRKHIYLPIHPLILANQLILQIEDNIIHIISFHSPTLLFFFTLNGRLYPQILSTSGKL